MRIIGLNSDYLKRALKNIIQFDSNYQKLEDLGLNQQACTHSVLDDIEGFDKNYSCLINSYDAIQQAYQNIKVQLTSESEAHDLNIRFKQYLPQAIQAIFDYLMAKEPSLQQLNDQLSRYEYDLFPSTSFKRSWSGHISFHTIILEKITAHSHEQAKKEGLSNQGYYFLHNNKQAPVQLILHNLSVTKACKENVLIMLKSFFQGIYTMSIYLALALITKKTVIKILRGHCRH
ncbi:hypothetical protein ACGP04_04330 [Piscirickettsia salmonis]|uniref:hypothetical protein n=1 Tax=Piscirickettsia salmonis TaxID=1238 RepID=UPI000F091B27|nr:hypothetical protein DA717_12790 [Piscirickettsiaceae bacterium NZ-RLO2]